MMDLLHVALFSLCIAHFGLAQLKSKKQVHKPPLIIVQPDKEVTFRVNHTVVLPCVASGSPQPEYHWKMDGKAYDQSGMADRVAIHPGSGNLTFVEPVPEDEGLYECIASNSMGSAISIKTIIRVAYLEPFLTSSTRTWTPNLGDPLTLPCVSPRGFPAPSLYWARVEGHGYRRIEIDERVAIDFTGALHFAHITKEDHQNGKTYACMAINPVTRTIAEGSYAKILPQGEAPVFNPANLVYHRASDKLAVMGQNVSITCIFSGNPTPIVSWSRTGSRNDELPNNTIRDDYGRTLTFVGVRLDHAGLYVCTAQNEVSLTPIQRSVSLRVEAAPEWVTGWRPESLEVEGNGTAVFYCKGAGIPSPNTLWYINGKPLAATERAPNTRVSENTLEFFNLTRSDSKVIQCNVTNKHGYVFTNAYLNVADACTTIMVSNTRWRPELEHNYTLVDSLCPIGPTYRHEEFYIWKETETRWSIGTNVCNGTGDIRASDYAAYPHLVTTKWNVRDEDGTWHYSTETRVECVAPTLPGAGGVPVIVPVVVSVCALLVILVIAVVCVVIKRRGTLIHRTIFKPRPIRG